MQVGRRRFHFPRAKLKQADARTGRRQMLGRAIATVAFVWLMAPHEPDLGFGCGGVNIAPPGCLGRARDQGAELPGKLIERVWQASQFMHEALLLRLDAVRDDFHRHLEIPPAQS
jgi:hypothetical protein